MTDPLSCPTCGAAWRGAATCPRCSTDLADLMRVAVKAWQLRDVARRALWTGDRPQDALTAARAACRLHETRYGQQLLALALLANGRAPEARLVVDRLARRDAGGRSARPSDLSTHTSGAEAGGRPDQPS